MYLAAPLLMSIPGLDFSGSVHRGIPIGTSGVLKDKHRNFKTEYAPGTLVYLPAPTSTSIDVAKARDFMGPGAGILYTMLNVYGLRLRVGELSVYDEAEVLLMGPMVYKVKSSAADLGNVVHVTLVAMPKKIFYLEPLKPEIQATAEVIELCCDCIILP